MRVYLVETGSASEWFNRLLLIGLTHTGVGMVDYLQAAIPLSGSGLSLLNHS